MRISDWSSDVCSSDLEVIADALEALFHLLQCQPSPTSDPAYIAPAPCRIVCEVFTVEPFGADSIAVLILMRDPENALLGRANSFATLSLESKNFTRLKSLLLTRPRSSAVLLAGALSSVNRGLPKKEGGVA